MMFHIALYNRLSAIAPNLYPVVAPEGYSKPAVVYHVINTFPSNDQEGVECAMLTLKLHLFDPDFNSVKALAVSIRNNLSAWRDANVLGVTWDDETDMIDDSTPVTLYHTILTFHVLATV